ncbi:MAG: rhodanese-like domain-containing protein [Thermoanaerobaculia bacterium]
MFARLLGLKTVDPATLQRRMLSEKLAIFDVNARASWLTARVPGARHLDGERFERGNLPPELDATLVFYCSNPLCRKAPLAARRARKMGFDDVMVLSAGISGWLAAGLPAESGA